MKKVIFVANLIVISAVLGMQSNFTEENCDPSRSSMRSVNVQDSVMVKSYESFTDRDWVSKIVCMISNEEDFNAPQNSDGQTILMCATKYANCKIMQQVLNVKDNKGNRRADINAQDKNGETALSIANKIGDKEKILLLLINQGIEDFNAWKKNNRAIDLIRAAQNGHIEIVKLLLDFAVQNQKNIDLNKQDETGATALMRAAQNGHVEIVKLLLDFAGQNQKNIDLNEQDETGATALIRAAQNGHVEIVKLLLDFAGQNQKNIDLNEQIENETVALVFAVHNDHVEVVEQLLKQEKTEVNAQDKRCKAVVLRLAVQKGHVRIVEQFLKCKEIEVDEEVFSLAVRNGHEEIVKLLLDFAVQNQKNIDLNKQDETGATALMRAAQNGHVEVVKLLLDFAVQNQKNIDLNKQDETGATALIRAAQNGHVEIVKLFLQKGIDINKRCFDEFTALMYAVEAGNARIVKLLLQQPGINLDAQNTEGETALNIANKKGRSIIIKLIQSKMGLKNQQIDPFIKRVEPLSSKKIYEEFIQAVSRGDINKMDSLLEEEGGADSKNVVNAKNKNEDTPLIIASDKGNLGAVRLLLEYGADSSFKDAHGNNALIRAAKKGHFDVVEELLFRGRNINSVGQDNTTALMAASGNGHVCVVKLLIKKGAKVSVKNKYDKTALDIVNEKIEKLDKINSNYESIKSILENQSKKSSQLFDEAKTETSSDKWEIVTDKNYEKDLKEWGKNDPTIYDKIQKLIKDIENDPFRGLGRPKRLTGDLEGAYSRRITDGDRLVYEIDGDKVILKSCKGHYEKDKRNRSRTDSTVSSKLKDF